MLSRKDCFVVSVGRDDRLKTVSQTDRLKTGFPASTGVPHSVWAAHLSMFHGGITRTPSQLKSVQCFLALKCIPRILDYRMGCA
jgi:hypothetical protein